MKTISGEQMTTEHPMKRERHGFYLNILAVMRRIRHAKLIYWPMSFAGIFFLLAALIAEPVEVLVVVPTNVIVRVLVATNGSPPVPPYGQIPPFTVMTNLCDVPITYVTSNSTNTPGGANVRTYRNFVFRRAAVQTTKGQK